MYSNEKQNILWLTKMENNVLLVRDLPLSDFDTGADDGKTIKLENVDSSLVLLPDNKLAFVDTERRIFSISMMTGEQTPIPAQFEASARCSLLGLIFIIFFMILKIYSVHSETDSGNAADDLVFNCEKHVRFVIDINGEHRILNTAGTVERLENAAGHFVALVRTSNDTFKLFNVNTGENLDLRFQGHVRLVSRLDFVCKPFEYLYHIMYFRSLWPNLFTQSSQSIGFDVKSVVFFADQTLSMIQRGTNTPKWERQESLTNIASLLLVDLPTDSATDVDPYNWTFGQRVSIQMQLLKAYLATTWAEIETGIFLQPKTRDPLINEIGLVRDQFNLHKVIFIVTSNGNTFGLDSLDGSILWKKRFSDIDGCTISTVIQKDTSINYGIAVIVAKCSEEVIRIVKLNPVNGRILGEESTLDGDLLRVDTMRTMDDQHFHPLLVFRNQDGAIHAEVIGDEPEQKQEIEDELSSTFYWFVKKDIGQLQGGQIELSDNQLSGKVEIKWTFQLPANQKIDQVKSPDRSHIIHSQGKPLADRSVLYKYLNPNMIAILTTTSETDNVELMIVTLYIIDGVTGEVIHTGYHRRMKGKLNLLFSENWLVYSYWAAKMHRTELTVVELYEGQTEPNRSEWSSLDNNKLPIALQNSFIIDEVSSFLSEFYTVIGYL